MTENIKDGILKAAHSLFARKGVRVVAVSDVCRELGMSKKTFYQYYDSKEDLVADIVEMDLQSKMDNFSKIVSEHDPVEAFVILEGFMDDKSIARENDRMAEDIKKYYPDTFRKVAHKRRLSLRTIILSCLAKGVEGGFFKGDFSMETFFMMQVFMFKGLQQMCGDEGEDIPEGFDCNPFLREACTIIHHTLFTPAGWDRFHSLTRPGEQNMSSK